MGYALASARRQAAALALAMLTGGAALVGCSDPGTGPGAQALIRQEETLINGSLRHRVDVSIVGDTATVRSVVENVGANAASVETRICGLDVDPSLPWGDAVRCGGYSRSGQLAPGDSLVESDRRIIDRADATIRVRHLLTPETWVPVSLR
jgi:hypothetical protein